SRPAVDDDALADGGREAAKAALPEGMADEDHRTLPGPAVPGSEASAEDRLDAEQVEDVPGGADALDFLRLARTRERDAAIAEELNRRHVGDRPAVALPVEKVRRRDRKARFVGLGRPERH